MTATSSTHSAYFQTSDNLSASGVHPSLSALHFKGCHYLKEKGEGYYVMDVFEISHGLQISYDNDHIKLDNYMLFLKGFSPAFRSHNSIYC